MSNAESMGLVAPIPPTVVKRTLRFLASPIKVKRLLIARHFSRWLPSVPCPVQLRFGSWWLMRGSALDFSLAAGSFENAESQFVARILKPGWVVLDVGAHHGLYTLLASRCVGKSGTVVAFEPSPRERVRLEEHVQLNDCQNVRIRSVALGASRRNAELFLVESAEDYCNSLRPPAVEANMKRIPVEMTTLDTFLENEGVKHVDFTKLDVEGAELEVLQGAQKLLETVPRPIMLVEVFDIRTHPWGYRARDIVSLLAQKGYRWFRIAEGGILRGVSPGLEAYDSNLAAIPQERVPDLT